jgi:hypothetical protein
VTQSHFKVTQTEFVQLVLDRFASSRLKPEVLEEMLRRPDICASLQELQSPPDSESLFSAVKLLYELREHEELSRWHPPSRKHALRAARCLSTQAKKWPTRTKPFENMILKPGPGLRCQLRRIVFYSSASLFAQTSSEARISRLLSKRVEQLLSALEDQHWDQVKRDDLTWLAEALEECSTEEVRGSAFDLEILLVKLLDDAGLKEPHLMATRLINALHQIGTEKRRKTDRTGRGEELRSPDLKKRYAKFLNLNPIARNSKK